jgi:hypothetical protein
MTKTGERYAAARRHVVDDPAPLPPRVAEPTMSEASITKGTGHGWDHWLRLLDDWGATGHTHTEIARHVRDDLGLDGWWAQSVTVGYEWARGMRQRHEVAGGYQVSVSKTIAAPAQQVWRDFIEVARRDTWLAPGTITTRPRTGSPGKSGRFDAADGRLVGLYLTAKGDRTGATVTCEGLAGPDEVETVRAAWRARLADLAARWAGTPTVAAARRRAS